MEKQIVLEVPNGGLLRVKDARGSRVTCLQGSLWLTQEQSIRDVLLEAGQSFDIERDGVTLVQGMADSRLGVRSASTRPGGVFVQYSDFGSAVPA